MTTSLFDREAVRVVSSPRLSQVLFDKKDRRFGSLAALPSNVEAIDAALNFAIGHRPFTVIAGPTGWGKTHLLECVSTHLATEFRVRSKIHTALDWLGGRAHIEPRTPLILDDVQEAMQGTKLRVMLRLGLERRIKSGNPVILAITTDKLTRHHRSFLPSIREWSQHEISQPSIGERHLLVEFMMRAEGLQLSSSLTKVIAQRMKGNGNTYHGALNILKMADAQWNGLEEIIMACGILNRFFADDSGWDLKEKIWVGAQKTAVNFHDLDVCGLCCHTMLRVAKLGELDVARFCGIEPSTAGAKALRFQKSMQSGAQDPISYKHFLETTVESLHEA